ncbi:MAG: hypothetical protein GYB31_13005 [Bacteroidetes bacterium]|nr:hypothetical protein [Bacteroidota bacterium]
MNGHRPQATLLPHSDKIPVQDWQQVEVQGDVLILTGSSSSNSDMVRQYKRMDAFPE